ncbi:MAG: hypothetical protein AAGB23_11160 [Pseudomonadota bacterium]
MLTPALRPISSHRLVTDYGGESGQCTGLAATDLGEYDRIRLSPSVA